MPNTTGSRIVLTPGQHLRGAAPKPTGRRGEVAEYLEDNGFVRDVATRSRLPADPGTANGVLTIALPSERDVEYPDGSVERLYDVYSRVTAEPLDRRELQALRDTLTLFGVPVVAALQEFKADDLIRLDLVAEQLITGR